MLWLSLYRATVTVCSFFTNDSATTDTYTLSLHDALPIYFACSHHTGPHEWLTHTPSGSSPAPVARVPTKLSPRATRSEEHTSELQSHSDLVCRLLLEKKKNLCQWEFRSYASRPF